MLCGVQFRPARNAATQGPKPDKAPARSRLTASRPRKLAPDGDGSIASVRTAESAAMTISFDSAYSSPARLARDQGLRKRLRGHRGGGGSLRKCSTSGESAARLGMEDCCIGDCRCVSGGDRHSSGRGDAAVHRCGSSRVTFLAGCALRVGICAGVLRCFLSALALPC